MARAHPAPRSQPTPRSALRRTRVGDTRFSRRRDRGRGRAGSVDARHLQHVLHVGGPIGPGSGLWRGTGASAGWRAQHLPVNRLIRAHHSAALQSPAIKISPVPEIFATFATFAIFAIFANSDRGRPSRAAARQPAAYQLTAAATVRLAQIAECR